MTELLRIFALSESTVTVEFGNIISPELNAKAISLADHFNADPFVGMIEAVPAYASTTFFFDPEKVEKQNADAAFSSVSQMLRVAVDQLICEGVAADARIVEIPVTFDTKGEFDLAFVAETAGLAVNEVIEIFTADLYRVYMLGFLPGFAYLGVVDDRIATPRRDVPRKRVPKGSVGIAGRQTGIYPAESPGGWQIIGRTETEMLIDHRDQPSFLRPGDSVRFIAS